MPNHITNIISFSDISAERTNEILEAIKDDEFGIGSIDFNKLIPMPEHIFKGNLGTEEREKYGRDNWYDWSVAQWGSKWNAYDFLPFDEAVKTIEFHTAWSTVPQVFRALSEKYPEAIISVSWSDEDFGYNVGKREYQNGDVIFEDVPMGGSKEAYEMAAEIQGVDLEEDGYRLTEDGTSYEYVDDDVIEQPDEKIKVVLVKPMQKPQVVEIGSSLESMQATVGGCIEQIMPFDEEVALVCNEDGKNDGLPLNRALKNSDGKIVDIIVGDFFICSAKGENFTSLTDEQVKRYSEMFKNPERFQQTPFGIKAIPVIPKNKNYER
jgi:hypothetical protein